MKTITNNQQDGIRRFDPGKINYSLKAAFTFSQEQLQDALAKHLSCDWGNVDAEMQEWNDFAVKNAEEIKSYYLIQKAGVIEIVTTGDRSATTIMLPSEY